MPTSDRFCAIITNHRGYGSNFHREVYIMELPSKPETVTDRNAMREMIRACYKCWKIGILFVTFSDEAEER